MRTVILAMFPGQRILDDYGQATFLQEILFQAPQLLVEQVVGLVNQANNDVGDGCRRI